MTCPSPSEISLCQHRVARTALRRYGIPAAVLVDALAEAERSRAQGGLGALGSILEQRRVVCAGQALELNRLERDERWRIALDLAWSRIRGRVFAESMELTRGRVGV